MKEFKRGLEADESDFFFTLRLFLVLLGFTLMTLILSNCCHY